MKPIIERTHHRSKSVAVLSIIALSTLLTACDRDMADLEEYVKDRRQAHAGYVEPLPEYEIYEGFSYVSLDLRDPFGIPVLDASSPMNIGSNKNKPDLERRREALEMYPLDTLEMVGELGKGKLKWGLIRDSDGIVHRVKTGNFLGQSFGRITEVSESSVHIEETIQDGLGNWITREAQLTLGEK